jgi:hypothetical protein
MKALKSSAVGLQGAVLVASVGTVFIGVRLKNFLLFFFS